MTALPADVALLVIDLQPDFMPGGTLACEQGDALVAPITALLAERRYRTVVATQDCTRPTMPRLPASIRGICLLKRSCCTRSRRRCGRTTACRAARAPHCTREWTGPWPT